MARTVLQHAMRRAVRELARGARAQASQASTAQASAFTHECRSVASYSGWGAGDAGVRRLQPLLQPQGASRRSLLPPALAVSLQARWNSARAPPPPLPEVPPLEVDRLGPLLADSEGGRVASEVAAIAAESNFAISSLQYMIEWFHVSCDLPWCASSCVGVRTRGLTKVQVGRHRGFDLCTALYDFAAHSEADEEHR